MNSLKVGNQASGFGIIVTGNAGGGGGDGLRGGWGVPHAVATIFPGGFYAVCRQHRAWWIRNDKRPAHHLLFRGLIMVQRIRRPLSGKVWGTGVTENVVWSVVKECAAKACDAGDHLRVTRGKGPR
jgi:hypothetical protein